MPKPKYDREQRFRWYRQVDKYHRPVKETCQIFGISRKTYYYWRTRDFGRAGPGYTPVKKQPNIKLTSRVKKIIEECKQKTNYGPLKMKQYLHKHYGIDVSTTIIYRYYQRAGLIRKPQRRMPWYRPMKQALRVVKPGQGVQMDVKYVYPNGHRQYQFSVLDPYSKKYHFSVFDTKESNNAIRAIQAAGQYFGFTIASVQTDNGSEFRGNFHTWLTKHDIPHYFIPKSSPYWNANVERVHRTIDDEYYHNPHRVWQTPYEWLRYYNFERLHLSLDGLTPQEKVLQSVTIDC